MRLQKYITHQVKFQPNRSLYLKLCYTEGFPEIDKLLITSVIETKYKLTGWNYVLEVLNISPFTTPLCYYEYGYNPRGNCYYEKIFWK